MAFGLLLHVRGGERRAAARLSFQYAYDALRCHLGVFARHGKEGRCMSRIEKAGAIRGGPRITMVSWIRFNPRSRDLAAALDAQAVYMPWAWHGQSLFRTSLGWLRSGLRTWSITRSLPAGSVVVTMAPPVFCPLVAVWAARGRGVRVVIDLHSGGLNDPRWRWSFGVMRWLIRRVEAVIVTNPDLLEGQDTGTTPVLVIQDPFWIGARPKAGPPPTPGPPYAVFPASGAADEPVEALAEAATLLNGQVEVVVTGDRPALPERPGLRLTGFLPADRFDSLMAHATMVLALTTREATMQRAAYEGLHLGRPLVCSDTRVLRRVLGDAAVFVGNTGPAIAAGIREALARADQLEAAGAAVREAITAEAERGLAAVRELAVAAPSLGSRPRGRDRR
jgi:glycosyltransferase involved in cell wall biosynthesis